MYSLLLFSHSIFRWLVLCGLVYSIFIAYKGYMSAIAFTKRDEMIKQWTVTIAHIQLLLGFTLYFTSPVVKYFFAATGEAMQQPAIAFFGIIHISLMFTAIIMLTIGSSLVKRKTIDKEKFRTMLIWFSIALLIIFISIPWPFSPLANRPYFRNL